MTDPKSIVAWLKDAYAMEQGAIKAYRDSAGDAKDQSEIQSRLNQHAEESERHAELIKGCVERLGDSTSAIKTGIANVTSLVQGFTSSMAQDTNVKNALAGYASEHFEIASYTSLIAAARAVGDEETARVCESILQEEEAMAAWYREQIPLVTTRFLAQQTS